MTYHLILSRSAEKALYGFTKSVVERLSLKIDALASNPRPYGYTKLVDMENRFRIRVGDYRILYSIDEDDKVVTIHRIAQRSEAYE